MNTGGPAFPGTLLDWFAGQALAGVIADPAGSGCAEGNAWEAYQIATAMLAEKSRCEALVQESSTTDHSGEANKMVELEAQNRELEERIKQLEEAGNDLAWWFCQKEESQLSSMQSVALKRWRDLRGRRNP